MTVERRRGEDLLLMPAWPALLCGLCCCVWWVGGQLPSLPLCVRVWCGRGVCVDTLLLSWCVCVGWGRGEGGEGRGEDCVWL